MTLSRDRWTLALLACALSIAACAPKRVAVLPSPPSEIRRKPAVPSQAVPSQSPPSGAAPTGPVPAAPAVMAPPDYPQMYREAVAATRRALSGADAGPAEAIRAWGKLESSPWAQDAVFNQGVLLHLGGDVDGAAARFRRLATSPPVFEPAAANLLGILILRGDREDLARQVDILLPAGAPPSRPMLPELAANLAAALVELGRTDRAGAILSGLEERGVRSSAAVWTRAVLSAKAGEIAEARRLAMKIPAEFSDLFPVTASRRAWEPEEAEIPDIDLPRTADPRMTALARNLKALALYREGRPADAEALLEGSPGEKPFPGETMSNLGLSKLSRGRWSEARALFERATRQYPEVPAGWLNLGLFLEVYEGNAPRAAECYKRYIGLNGPRRSEVATWIERLQGSPSR